MGLLSATRHYNICSPYHFRLADGLRTGVREGTAHPVRRSKKPQGANSTRRRCGSVRGLLPAVETGPAQDRSAHVWQERNCSGSAAFCACDCSFDAPPNDCMLRLALLAVFRLVLKLLVSEEDLFAGAEDEFLSAIDAFQDLVSRFHGSASHYEARTTTILALIVSASSQRPRPGFHPSSWSTSREKELLEGVFPAYMSRERCFRWRVVLQITFRPGSIHKSGFEG